MADTKISALTALTGANVDTAADVFPIVDTSAGATKKILVDEVRIALIGNTKLTNSLGGDVTLNDTNTYFTGPVVSQGTTGTWFFSGTVTFKDTTGAATFSVKLWDGTTVIASAIATTIGANNFASISLSGYLATPAADVKISVKDTSSTNGKIIFNDSGAGKDSTISAFRIG